LEINWSTFFLEIINFLVLVWLLKRFFYQPVSKLVEQRRLAVDQQIADAQQQHAEAEKMKQQYENRLTVWEQEKQQARDALNNEMHTEKTRQLAVLEKKLTQQNEKNRIAQEKQFNEIKLQYEIQALSQGAQFSARLLNDLSTVELEKKLIDLFIDNLSHLPSDQQIVLSKIDLASQPLITINSAFALDADHKQRLCNALQGFFAQPIDCEYKINKELIAGLRISMDSHVMRANLQDELQYFVESAHAKR